MLLLGTAKAQERAYSFTGNLDNDLATGNDGTTAGTVTYITDRFGVPNAAINLAGSGSSVNFGVMDSLNSKKDFTISFWMQKAPAGYQLALFGNGTKLFSYLDIGGSVINTYHNCAGTNYLNVPTTTLYSGIPTGTWFHYAVVMRNGWLFNYINGTLYSTSSFNGATCASSGDFTLGAAVPNIASSNNWFGGMDDLFIFSTGLTSTQIDSLKNLPNPCNASISISTQPTDVTVTTNSTVQFSTSSSSFGINYQWQVSTNGGATFTDLTANSIYSNVTSNTLSVAAVDTLNANLYRARITDGTCTVITNAAKLNYPIKVSWTLDGITTSTTGTNAFSSITASGAIAPTYTTDRFGNTNHAFAINNFTSYQNVTTSNLDFLSGTKEFTFSGWYLVANNAWLMYCAGGPNAVFKAYVNGSGAQQPILEFNTGTNTNSVINGNGNNTSSTWRHFVVSFKNGVAKMYVNGLLVSQSVCSYGKMPSTFSSFAITNTYVSASYFLNGSFDDVTVCNWAMTQNEVDSLYNAPNPCAAIIPITMQPIDVMLDNPATTSFSVSTSASGITYQWQRSTNDGANYTIVTDGGAFSGATTATLTVVVDTSFTKNKFKCVLSNGSSCAAYSSAEARLHVSAPAVEVQYPLDAGSTLNALGSSYHGTLVGGSGTAATDRFGVSNGAMQLGNGSYVSLGNPAFVNNSNALTFNGWFKKEAANVNYKFFLSKDNGFFVRTDLTATFNGCCYPVFTANGLDAWNSIPESAWFMHTAVFNNGTFDLYANGIKIATIYSPNFTTSTTTGNVVVGGKVGQIAPSPTPTYPIDDIYLGNRAWSASKIDSVYQATKACNITWVTQPETQILSANTTVTLTATPSSTNGTFVWQVSTDNGTTYTNLTNVAPYSNVTTTALTIAATSALDQNLYRLVMTNATCFTASNSARINLSKNVAYNFNNQTAQNILGTNNQGSLSAGVTYSADRFSNASSAISVDAANNFMSIGNLSFINEANTFSYVGWYKKPTAATASGELFSVKALNTWTSTQESSRYLRAYLSNNIIYATASGLTTGLASNSAYALYTDINPDEWFQFAYVVNYPSLKIYLNGKLYAQQTLTQPLMNVAPSGSDVVPDGVLIGAYHNNIAPSWSSDIDDIYITPKALTVTQLDSMRTIANPCPAITSNASSASSLLICNGTSTTLRVQNTGVNYNWYDAPISGNLLGIGVTYTTSNLTANETYFVEAIMPTCSTVNARTPIMVTVKPVVNDAVNSTPISNLTLCPNQTTTLTATGANGDVISWWDAATAGNFLGIGNSFTTAPVSASKSFYAAGSNGTCLSANRTQVDVVVDSNKTASLSILPFSCPTNISGTTIRFPLKAVCPGIVTIGSLTKEAINGDTTTVLVAPGTTYTVTANDNGCLASVTVTAPTFTANQVIVAGSVCQSCAIRNNKTYTFFDITSNQKLVTINDPNNATSLGNIDVRVNVGAAFAHNTNFYMGRNYHLTPDTSSNASIRLFFTGAEFSDLQSISAGANLGSLYVVAFDGLAETPSSYTSLTNYGPFTAQLDAAGNYYIDVPVSGFSGFYIASGNATALAASTIDISANVANEYAQINWTVNNTNATDYLVQRSYDATTFETAGTVAAGTNNAYTFTDAIAQTGTVYYRVQGLVDGKIIASSSMTSVQLKNNNALQILPNPTQGKLNIISNDFKSCAVIDLYGKILMQSSSKSLNLSELPAGQYLIVVKGSKTITTQKVVKQ
jgi:hypothetical protein